MTTKYIINLDEMVFGLWQILIFLLIYTNILISQNDNYLRLVLTNVTKKY